MSLSGLCCRAMGSAAAVLLLPLLIGSAHPARAAGMPGPDTVAASVTKRGAAATLAELDRSGRLDGVLDRIASGQRSWVALVPKLAAGADEAAAEGLGIALADALPRAPGTVLAVLDPADGHLIGAGRVCGVPFIERSPSTLQAYRRRTLRAVAGVRDPALAAVRDACLAALGRAG